MDSRAAKLALARKKLKNHQEKKVVSQKEEVAPVAEADMLQDHMQQTVSNTEQDSSTPLQNIEGSGSPIIQEFPASSQNFKVGESDINVTEILISNKRNLEIQIGELQTKLKQLENDYVLTTNNLNVSMQQVHNLEMELKNLHENHLSATKALQEKNNLVKEMNEIKTSLLDQNNNLIEQLEFTKTILTAKETENASLHSQLSNLQNQLHGTKLQLQQLINGSSVKLSQNNDSETPLQNEVLLQKISTLEHQLKSLQKERDQINLHYEHYVAELNNQLKTITKRNEDMSKEILNLSNRESSLIEQISDMEIRLQNYNPLRETVECQTKSNIDVNELQKKYDDVQEKLQNLNIKYEEVKIKFLNSEAKIKELLEAEQADNKKDDISFLKLNADIASDKIAAQRATEQNKKLKNDMQELEQAFIKMSRDKLELTEKLTAEKFLNRELTIKLAEVEENAKNMQTKLRAKDEEMIRLQTSYRTVENEYKILSERIKNTENYIVSVENGNQLLQADSIETSLPEDSKNEFINTNCEEEHRLIETDNENNSSRIQKEVAMSKLQERFLKIMEEVADLSDEKHRLEHIILQLQNETDTICEYVALYQQQRSILKRRDEERSAQVKIFQDACDKLKNQVEELSNVLVKFAEDKELTTYFQVASRRSDMEKVMELINRLKNNCLIDPKRKSVDFKDFYPCSCCSGKLLEV